jgi:hypothetical protein
MGPAQVKPAGPEQVVMPAQLPTPGTSLVHAAPPPRPSSITKLQSLSAPSQLSVAGLAALHADQPATASQVSVPQQVPIAFVDEQVRLAPAMAALQLQLAVIGWQ